MQIRVIPDLPNPDSKKIYRLQVGSYAVHNTAEKMAQRIRSAGLQANVENYNSLKRVVVPGVRAADAYVVVQMLESMGFQEVWVRE
jgi:cell division protein FtsN